MYHYIIANRDNSTMTGLEFMRFVKANNKYLKSDVLRKFKRKYKSLKSKSKVIVQISEESFKKRTKNKRVTVFK